MIYSFYPRCEEACPKVKCCPHLGGANVASVVLMANDNEEFRRFLQGTISAERERNARLFDELFGNTFTPTAGFLGTLLGLVFAAASIVVTLATT